MDESKSNDSQKNDISSGSALRKGGVIGAFAGALFAIAIHVYATFASIRFGDFSFYFLSFIQAPAISICKKMGLAVNNASGNLAFLPFCISVVITSFFGAILGLAIGNLFKSKQQKG